MRLHLHSICVALLAGAPAVAGGWTKHEAEDQLRQTSSISYSLEAKSYLNCGAFASRPVLVLSCSGAPTVQIHLSGCPLEEGYSAYQIDDNETYQAVMLVNSSRTAGALMGAEGFENGTYEAPEILSRILDGSAMLIEVGTIGDQMHIVEFEIGGLTEVGPDLLSCPAVREHRRKTGR